MVVTQESDEKATGTDTCWKMSLVITVLLAATLIRRLIAAAVRTHGCRPATRSFDTGAPATLSPAASKRSGGGASAAGLPLAGGGCRSLPCCCSPCCCCCCCCWCRLRRQRMHCALSAAKTMATPSTCIGATACGS
eukprot:scaffold2367_cov58-Phaeocystis_antarctica.AAC.6